MSEQCFSYRPSLVDLANNVLGGYTYVVELNFVEVVLVVDADDGIHLDSLRLHVHQDKGDAFLFFTLVTGSHQNKNPVGILGVGGPNFGAVDNIVIAVQLGLGLE